MTCSGKRAMVAPSSARAWASRTVRSTLLRTAPTVALTLAMPIFTRRMGVEPTRSDGGGAGPADGVRGAAMVGRDHVPPAQEARNPLRGRTGPGHQRGHRIGDDP